MITASDCVIALSNSGSTHEILTLLPLIKRLGIPLISMTGSDTSELAQAADVHLLASVETEACPLNLAPTLARPLHWSWATHWRSLFSRREVSQPRNLPSPPRWCTGQ